MTTLRKFQPDSKPVAIIGAGTLGSRIALMLSSSGGEVRIFDKNPNQLQVARRFVEAEMPHLIESRKGARARAGRLVLSTDFRSAIGDVWMVVEAIPERVDLKRELFGELDRLTPKTTILASNSSSFPSSQFIDRVEHKYRVVNTHYYMPPQQNAVEIMSCGHTDREILDALFDRFPLYGLVPFRVLEESVGFIFNRIWAAVKRECLAVVAEGISSPSEVDRMFQVNLGTHGGPFRLMDKVGLDVVLDIEEHYAAIRPGIPVGPRDLLKKYIAEGKLGVKSAQGFYTDYSATTTDSGQLA